MIWRWCSVFGFLIGAVNSGCTFFASNSSDAFGRYESREIDEPSGLVASRRQPGLFWTHNDSGDTPRLFAVTGDGKLIAEFSVIGASAKDWEAIAIDDQGRLYIGDIGNNLNRRRDLVIYRVPEPQIEIGRPARSGVLTTDMSIEFYYPEQKAFPDLGMLNFDAEAIFWSANESGSRLYLLTKHRSDQKTVLYRVEAKDIGRPQAASRIGAFDVGGDPDLYGGRVTGAALSRDARYLAVLTYHAVFIFQRPPAGENYLAHLKNRIDLEQGVTQQVEAIAWDRNALLITNEQGFVFRLSEPMRPYPGRFPRPELKQGWDP